MKTITIDFTKTPAEISDKILGHQGEHNRTRLVITPPAEMAEDPNIIATLYVIRSELIRLLIRKSATKLTQ